MKDSKKIEKPEENEGKIETSILDLSQKSNNPMKESHFRLVFIAVALSAIVGSLFGFMGGGAASYFLKKSNLFDLKREDKSIQKSDSGDNKIVEKKLVQEDSAIIDVVKKATPSVVSIVITKDVQRFRSYYYRPFEGFPFFFDPFQFEEPQDLEDSEKQKIGGGSGFIVDKSGMVVTNKHVVKEFDADYTVVTSDGKEYPAKVVATHPILDIAILKIEGDNFKPIELGDSDNLVVGQTVIAIGNPLGEFANSVSKGIISGLKRNVFAGSTSGNVEKLTNLIQTDASINPGNSGGPLIDIEGRVIGVNVAMAQGAENIGFALPINNVKKTIEMVRNKGKISVPFLGVRYLIVDKEFQMKNNLQYGYGAMVTRGRNLSDLAVSPGSPADKAGLQEGDIILEANGEKITQERTLADIIAEHDPGDTLKLKVLRKGNIVMIDVVLGEKRTE